ncbi:MAG: DUF2393 domain-containing protein [Sulfurimonas sp.]|nr:DUF2393 domain-containing protein [Sulfurimonas sp.]
MTENFIAFLDGLIFYNYIFFGAIFSLFLLLTILGIILRHKVSLSIFLIILSFTILIIGSTLGHTKINQFIHKNNIKLTNQKHLTYSNAVVVYGVIKNSSKFDFKSCIISANVYKVSSNTIKSYIYGLKPFIKMSILESGIQKGQERKFKILIEPFLYAKDYNILLGANCR